MGLVLDGGALSFPSMHNLRVAEGMEEALSDPVRQVGYNEGYCLLKNDAGDIVRQSWGQAMAIFDPEFIEEGSQEIIQSLDSEATAAAESARALLAGRIY